MEDKLIKNYSLLICVFESTSSEQKKANIVRCLDDGADINARDANNKHNTVLHLAAQKGDKEVVQLLIDKGASNLKNSVGKSPLDLANDLIDINNRTEIIETLKKAFKPCDDSDTLPSNPHKMALQNKNVKKTKKKKEFFYPKRSGTSGVCGQLYETKLLSLALLRALNDSEIEKFYLGTNISGIGALDDICMRYEIKGHTDPIVLFVQAKHREDREKGRLTVEDVRSNAGDFSLPKYFDSYLRIKNSFKPNNEDDLFEGEFNSVECNLVIYTPVKDSFDRKLIGKNKLSNKVNDLIQTGQTGDFFQYHYDEDDVEFLTKMTVKDRIKKLGPTFLSFIMAEKDKSETMMTDELIKRYHVVLGREVVQVIDQALSNKSEINKPSTNTDTKLYHVAKFRPDFFTNNSEFLNSLREAFFKEISSTRCDKTSIARGEVSNAIEEVLQDPCASNISRIISKIVTFNDKRKKLEIIDSNNIKKEFKGNHLHLIKESLSDITIDADVIRDAIKMKLESVEFKLPTSFGNYDMSVRGSDAKVISRLDTVAEKIATLLKASTQTIVEINEDIVGPKKTLEQGIIDINGGIGGSVGNILIQDEDTKMIKFNTRNELPTKANEFLKKMTERISIETLENIRIRMNINGFPKYSFDGDEYDKRQAKDFLNRLWFYTNQAKEDEVENTLKKEINKYYNDDYDKNQFVFRVHSDAIFLRSHDEIQKWWMQPGKALYLSNASEFFEQAKKEVIDSPLLTVLNFMYINKVKKLNVEFQESAINALELNKTPRGIINVVTEASVLSGVKLMQYFQNFDSYAFIDFDYILSLPLNDYNTLIGELGYTKVQNLIIIYEMLKYYEGLCNKLKKVLKIFKGIRVVIVTDNNLASELKEYIGHEYQSVHDNSTYLIDLQENSQQRILKESRVVFQGEQLPTSSIIDRKARGLFRTEILHRLLKGERIEVGRPIVDQIYKDVKDYYVDRYLKRDDDVDQVNEFNDIPDTTVVISAKSGMGKSALLSHLSVNTKRRSPLPWLVRINLLDHEREFQRWQDRKIETDHTTTIQFLSNVALKNNEWVAKLNFADENNGTILTNAEGDTDPIVLFEIELFLHLYNEGKIIFLFDDFNAICQHYYKEVIGVLRVLKERRKRMWITTCSYAHTRAPLEREFGKPRALQPLGSEQKKNFLSRFFSTNLRLEKLNYDQFENMYAFMKHVSKTLRLKPEPRREFVPVMSLLFHSVYIGAARFFKSEINHVSPSILNEKLKEKFNMDLNEYSPVDTMLGRAPDDEELELAGTPLHVYMAANYFKCRLEDCCSFVLDHNECINKWKLIANTFTLYKNFIEDEIRKTLYKEYGADEDSVMRQLGTNKKAFLKKHKKLGLFTICRENDLTKLLREEEIDEVKNTIKRIESGEEKSILVECVVNDIPRFGHLLIAEYFAMEGLTDMMQQLSRDQTNNPLKNASLWQSLLNILLFKAPPGVRSAFDYKLQSDSALADIANSDMCKKVVFELLLKSRESRDEDPISEALQDRLFNVVNLFLSTAQCNLNKGNLDQVIDLFRNCRSMFSNFGSEYKDILKNLAESVKNLDAAKLGQIIDSGALTEVPLRHANNYCSSSDVNELTRRVATTAEQIPAIVRSVQQIVHGSANIGDVLVSAVETSVHSYLDDFMKKLRDKQNTDN